jgi:hypothetical protein
MATWVWCLVVLSWVAWSADGTANENSPKKSVACVNVSHQARFNGVGYNHWVQLENTCTFRVNCEVSTNVNPTVVDVQLASKESKEINTFQGSPASEFTPHVVCRQLP